MTQYTIREDITASSGAGFSLADGDSLTLERGVTVSTTGTYGIWAGSYNSLNIGGDVYGSLAGIDFYNISGTSHGYSSVHVLATGSVSSNYYGIFVDEPHQSVTNAGHITGQTGISIFGSNAEIRNTGTIAGENYGVFVGGGNGTHIVNTGTLSGGSYAIYGSPSDESITNTGAIVGRIDLGDGNDVLNSRTGTLHGLVDGGAGNDRLTGGMTADLLWGNSGRDTLTGGSGADTFLFKEFGVTDADVITDFTSGVDHIELDRSVFDSLGVHGVRAAQFYQGDAAHDANDYLVYTPKGALYYDADGTGAEQAVLVATLSGHPTLTADDFLIV